MIMITFCYVSYYSEYFFILIFIPHNNLSEIATIINSILQMKLSHSKINFLKSHR